MYVYLLMCIYFYYTMYEQTKSIHTCVYTYIHTYVRTYVRTYVGR